MANEEIKQNDNGEGIQVVAFKLLNEEYGISILNVQEIRNLTDITRVPFAADYIKGVINLRGSVLPVIDLKKRLGLADAPYTDNTRIVTVNVGEVHVGMLVDAVTEVLTIHSKPIDPKKAINGKEITKYLSGIGNVDGRLIIMLNLEEIVGLEKKDEK
ncbi:MAG: chemotaxis protein CheW [Selenomonadaceae bacterium]|nr:chemotaxis protein CheW [Selenomonadaceae bacterium]MDY2685464.1 chemotaxis protein CheW [Selenomonadaceae bacterium]